MRIPRVKLLATGCALLISVAPFAQKRNKKEEQTQKLQLPQDLPSAVTGDTRRLVFHVTPLSGKGLLSQQVRDALKALGHETGGETVLKIRAFMAGSADLRRVRDLVSATFSAHNQPLPAITLIQSGGLPLEGAQVVMESIAAARKDVNPHGLAWISPVVAVADDPLGPVAPLVEQSLAGLRNSVKAAGAEPSGVLRVTCFLSSLENLGETRKLVGSEYPRAALNYVQTQRAPPQALAACEGVARLRTDPPSRLQLMNAAGIPAVAGESRIALVGAPHVVLSGGQDSFGYQDDDGRLAFQRLLRSLEQAGASAHDIAFVNYYPLASKLAAQVRKVRLEFFDAAHPPAGTLLIFQALVSMDSGFGMDVVAVKD